MEDGHTSMAIHQQSNLPGTRVIADYPLAGLFDLVLRAHVPQDDRMITVARGTNLAMRVEGDGKIIRNQVFHFGLKGKCFANPPESVTEIVPRSLFERIRPQQSCQFLATMGISGAQN